MRTIVLLMSLAAVVGCNSPAPSVTETAGAKGGADVENEAEGVDLSEVQPAKPTTVTSAPSEPDGSTDYVELQCYLEESDNYVCPLRFYAEAGDLVWTADAQSTGKFEETSPGFVRIYNDRTFLAKLKSTKLKNLSFVAAEDSFRLPVVCTKGSCTIEQPRSHVKEIDDRYMASLSQFSVAINDEIPLAEVTKFQISKSSEVTFTYLLKGRSLPIVFKAKIDPSRIFAVELRVFNR